LYFFNLPGSIGFIDSVAISDAEYSGQMTEWEIKIIKEIRVVQGLFLFDISDSLGQLSCVIKKKQK